MHTWETLAFSCQPRHEKMLPLRGHTVKILPWVTSGWWGSKGRFPLVCKNLSPGACLHWSEQPSPFDSIASLLPASAAGWNSKTDRQLGPPALRRKPGKVQAENEGSRLSLLLYSFPTSPLPFFFSFCSFFIFFILCSASFFLFLSEVWQLAVHGGEHLCNLWDGVHLEECVWFVVRKLPFLKL